MKFWSFLLIILLGMQACTSKNTGADNKEALDYHMPPSWAREAIWYQIFVERFRNGNTEVEPTLQTIDNALIDPIPADWTVTPWGHNWYQQESWAKPTGLDFYRTIQMRRYGGDLAGVEEKIGYLKDLGITAIYFNPINDAPSLHKYDARHYHHIDVTFGDDIAGDMALMASEDPVDPSTWTWTTADKRFIALVKKLHDVGIRVVLDFSWNHTGNNFWAFKDIEKNLENSAFKDWYHSRFIKDSITGKTTFDYDGWIGIKNLPELRKIDTKGKIAGYPYEGNMHEEVKQHIFDVSKRWMDPEGNGNVHNGIDGMRLDVAEHVPVGFWRDFRKYVRSVNPEFYLVGENWWTMWPDELMDPAPWVQGDIFDAVMHYQWFKVARGYFSQPDDKLDLTGFKRKIDSVFLKYPAHTQQAMMNLASSHDSPRLLTSFFNVNKYKYRCKSQEDPQYRTNKPGQITYHEVKLFLLHQFTFIGSPHIWNGDEMGMFGADDPDNRKPLPWPDIDFELETQSPFSDYAYQEPVTFDNNMLEYYKSLTALRKSSPVLSYGSYKFVDVGGKNVLAYERFDQQTKDWFLVVFNVNSDENTIQLTDKYKDHSVVFTYGNVNADSQPMTTMPAYSAVVLQNKK